VFLFYDPCVLACYSVVSRAHPFSVNGHHPYIVSGTRLGLRCRLNHGTAHEVYALSRRMCRVISYYIGMSCSRRQKFWNCAEFFPVPSHACVRSAFISRAEEECHGGQGGTTEACKARRPQEQILA